MSRETFWRKGEPHPEIEAHSLAKHDLLYDYVREYVLATTRNPRMDRLRLTIVDGFAGGNIYRHWKNGEAVFGSPNVLMRAIIDAETEVRQSKLKDFTVDCSFVFIEKDEYAFSLLKETVKASPYYPRLIDRIDFRHGRFEDQCEQLIQKTKLRGRSGRSIFVLDQCGWSRVSLESVSRVLNSLAKAEVFMTFAPDSLINYLRKDEKGSHFIKQLGLVLPVSLDDTPGSIHTSRRAVQYAFYEHVRPLAKFLSPFFIRSEESNRDLWLLHFSKNYKARDVMVQQHVKHHNSSMHYGTSGCQFLGYEPGNDARINRQLLLNGYNFDEAARGKSIEALCEDIPPKLASAYQEGIDVRGLYSAICNEVPVTVGLLEEVLRILLSEKDIKVSDPTGSTKRRSGIELNDIIKPHRQTRLFF
jgi:three-Cys-motif partner protein